MGDDLFALKNVLQDSLDELSSPRSSDEGKFQALQTLDRCLATAFLPRESSASLQNFNALQYTFECNVPLRLLSWISLSTTSLELLTNKGTMDQETEIKASTLSSKLALSLSLIQGVSLGHPASKTYLGRKYALEVLLDLLLASRHLSSIRPTSPDSNASQTPSPPLTSIVLDTLLCILVDSPDALRVFENSGGVQAAVKILKRAGTPREVRMKCLEFLYFYLLDETPTPPGVDASQKLLPPTSPPIVPAASRRPSKPFISNRPLRPSSQHGPSPSFSTSSSTLSIPSSRSTSGSSMQSFSSTSSNASSSTPPTSVSSSPDKNSAMPPPQTPPSSPPLAHRQPQQLQPRSLMMLKKDVDFVPLSPKKVQVSRLGVRGSRHTPGKSISRSRLGSGPDDDYYRKQDPPAESVDHETGRRVEDIAKSNRQVRTTEEKKELLGTMLGNVDALVEGVRKAGIWGLG